MKAIVKRSYARNLAVRFGLLFLVVGALQVHAGKYYLKTDGVNFTDASQWQDENGNPSGESKAALSSEHDYVVKGFNIDLEPKGVCEARSMSIGEEDVGGRVLQAGDVRYTGSEGLFLVKGCWRSYSHNLRGKITVKATREAPFGIFSSSATKTLSLNSPKSDVDEGELIGDENSAIAVGLQYHIGENYYMDTTCKSGFVVDLYRFKNYKGLISVTSSYDNASCANGFGAAVKLSDPNGALPGDLRICGGGGLLLSTAADVYTVGELTLEPGSMIRTAVNLTDKTCNSVAASKLNVKGPVCVMADYQQKVSTDGKEVRCALLTAPANGLNLDDFYFMPDPNVTDESGKNIYQQRAHLEVSTENEIDTLYLVIEPIVRLLTGNNSDEEDLTDGSKMENPESWDGAAVPTGGRHYYVNGKFLKFLGDSDYTFPGKSLIHDTGRVLFSGERDIVISNYVWRNGIIYSMKNAGVRLKGKMTVAAVTDSTKDPARTLRSFKYPIEINSDISGGGDIIINNAGGDSKPGQGLITLSGNNSGYRGKITIENYYSASDMTSKKYTSLYVSNADNLGGALDTFIFDAISLKGYSRLVPTADMELPKTSKRGLFINGYGVIAPNENVTLRMEWPITMNGTLYKDGLGVLEMAGEIRFYDAENSASVENPRAEIDVLNLYKGTLKIGSAKACDGLRIDVQLETSILLPKPGTDSDLDKYGLYNVKAGATPFVLAEGVSKLPIAFEEQLSADSLEGMVTNALFTVANSAVESVRSMLPYGVKPYQGVRASIVEIPLADEEATTFACVTKQYGLMISIK